MRRLFTLILVLGAASAAPLAGQLELHDPWADLKLGHSSAPDLEFTPPQQSIDADYSARVAGAVTLGTLGAFAGSYVGFVSALTARTAAAGYTQFFMFSALGSASGAWMANRSFGRSFLGSLVGAALGAATASAFDGGGGPALLIYPIVQGITTGILGTPRGNESTGR